MSDLIPMSDAELEARTEFLPIREAYNSISERLQKIYEIAGDDPDIAQALTAIQYSNDAMYNSSLEVHKTNVVTTAALKGSQANFNALKKQVNNLESEIKAHDAKDKKKDKRHHEQQKNSYLSGLYAGKTVDRMQIYVARSIRGQHSADDDKYLDTILSTIKEHGHVPALETSALRRSDMTTDQYIYERDIEWIDKSQAIIAEVSNPSLGVGYEIAYATLLHRMPILVVAYRGVKVSAMIAGRFVVKQYNTHEQLVSHINYFFRELSQ